MAGRRALIAGAALALIVAYVWSPSDAQALMGMDGPFSGGPTGGVPALACDWVPGASLRVYSSRPKPIVGQVIERFQQETGVQVEVCYGNPGQVQRTILAEGSNTPADVYMGPNVLGLIGAGRLQKLSDRILTRVDQEFRATGGELVGVTGRARVVVYNTDRVSEDELPDSIHGFTDPAWAGRLGWAPTNGSFQAFVAALRIIEGQEGARDWLRGIQANRPMVYRSPGRENASIVEAVAAGEIDAGFVNSYYLPELCSTGPGLETVAGRYFTDGDPGAVIHVSMSAGVLNTSRNVPAAERFIEFLLENGSQHAFAQVCELPLVNGVIDESDELRFKLASLRQPALDMTRLEEEMESSRALLTEVTGVDTSTSGGD